eukprot:7717250-Pyramimonas_sp.AAC.1
MAPIDEVVASPPVHLVARAAPGSARRSRRAPSLGDVEEHPQEAHGGAPLFPGKLDLLGGAFRLGPARTTAQEPVQSRQLRAERGLR